MAPVVVLQATSAAYERTALGLGLYGMTCVTNRVVKRRWGLGVGGDVSWRMVMNVGLPRWCSGDGAPGK